MAEVTHGMIIAVETGAAFMFDWNPEKIQSQYGAKWVPVETAGAERPYHHYACGMQERVHFRLQLATGDNDPGYVDRACKQLADYARPTVPLQGMAVPPNLILQLGTNKWRCRLEDCSVDKHTSADQALNWRFADVYLTFLVT